MIDRWGIIGEGDDFLEVSVPDGRDGDSIRSILDDDKLRGVGVTIGKSHRYHSDGRWYHIAIIKGYDAQDVANRCIAELAELPMLLDERSAAAIARHENIGAAG